MKRLIDIYRDPMERGIFFDMFNDEEVYEQLFKPLGMDSDDAHAMDMDYYFNVSGTKLISGLLEHFCNNYVLDDDGEYVINDKGKRTLWDYFVIDTDKNIINRVIKQKFLLKWTKYLKTVLAEYDMLSPFTMEITDDATSSSNKNATKKQTDTNTRERTDNATNNTDTTVTNNLQTTSTESTSNDEEEGIAAFNSTDYSNSTKKSKSGSAEESVTNTGTVGTDSEQTSSGTTNENVSGTTDVTDTSSENATEKRSIIRKGNIGNLTFADIISGERTMLAYQLFDTIYADLDNILTRGMYM